MANIQLRYSEHLCSQTTVVVLYPFFLYPCEEGAKGLKRWFQMYITQIKPLEKRNHECALKLPHLISNNAIYNQNNHEIYSEPLCERGYDVVFHV